MASGSSRTPLPDAATPKGSPPPTPHAQAAGSPRKETLATSRSIWGYMYRMGGPPIVKRTDRTIYANNAAANAEQLYVDNTVTTSRYTWYNFVPMFLFQQFSRFANFYFLIVCILQAIPEISITSGVPSSAIPLAFVLFFDGIVTAREDYVRHRDDARANARKVLAMRAGAFKPVEWREVAVGDILKVQQGDEFPADLLFLAAENEDVDQRGVCHVQTAQLDGETNLKMRMANERTVALFPDDAACAAFRGRIVCEEPHENFAKFNGTIYAEEHAAARGIGLDANSTLLRGCVLKNVPAIYGMVVYTGRETKVRVRQTSGTSKKASVEAEINRYIVALIGIQMLLCVAGAVGYGIWGRDYAAASWYLQMGVPSPSEGFARFFTFFLLISNIIPISLYVSMKLARTSQKMFMDADPACCYIDRDLFERTGGEEGRYPLVVRTMDLNDELGQISHIFSDKTGTLTSNYMEFRKMTINGVLYGRGTTEIGMARRRRLGLDTAELEALMKQAAAKGREVPHVNYIEGSETHPGRVLRGPASDISGTGRDGDPEQARALHLFLLNLVLNHTVVQEAVRDKHDPTKVHRQLSASSPDEEAFVLAASFFGYEFVDRQNDEVVIRVQGVEQRFRVVAVIPYSSARQMMSVIVEDLQCPPGDEQHRFILFAKGSDVRMFKLNITETRGAGGHHHHGGGGGGGKQPAATPSPDTPTPTPGTGNGNASPAASPAAGTSTTTMSPGEMMALLDTQSTLISASKAQLLEMAEDGLRTLAFSYKYVDSSAMRDWQERYEEALGDIAQKRLRDAKLPNAIDDTAGQMERDLLFQGATANEDKLQEQVPETIALLAQAGIKVYMLTGDKQETAINIGYAARMLTNEYARILITSEELYGDRAQEDVARRRKAQQVQAAAAAGLSHEAHAEAARWELPPAPHATLETNARAKLRIYANIARAKASRGAEFSRARCLVVDEQVLNLIWPSLPVPVPVKPDTVLAAYKDTATAVARAAALLHACSACEYADYVDGQWVDAEADSCNAPADAAHLTTATGKALVDDGPARTRIAHVLAAAGCPDLLGPDGLAVIQREMRGVLAIQKELRVLEIAAHDAANGIPGAHALTDADLETMAAHRAEIEKIVTTLAPLINAAYAAASAVMRELAPGMQADLLVLAESCKSVIACRCRPDQKKKMLELVKHNVPTSRTLAVGDGANDVDMIQASNVGVGIIGPEGVQAANASDYAIGRFKFLKRLLLVHGRWNYNRMAQLICYMYYKNVFYAVAQMLYTIVAAWSGQKFYVEAASQTYNIFYTGIPILLVAVFDQDVSEDNALKFPYLYNDGLTRKRLNIGILLWWLVSAIYESVILFVFGILGAVHPCKDGATPYVFELGTWIFTALVILVNLRLALNTYKHTWLFSLMVVLSVGIWFPLAYVMDAVDADGMRGGMQHIFGSGSFWLWLLLVAVASQVPQAALGFYRRFFYPEYRDLVTEYETLMVSSGKAPSRLQACCTCGLRRATARTRLSPAAMLAALDAKAILATTMSSSGATSGTPTAGAARPTHVGVDVGGSGSGGASSDHGATSHQPAPSTLSSPGSASATKPLLTAGAVPPSPAGSTAGATIELAGRAPVVPGGRVSSLPIGAAELDVDFGPDLSDLPGQHDHALTSVNRRGSDFANGRRLSVGEAPSPAHFAHVSTTTTSSTTPASGGPHATTVVITAAGGGAGGGYAFSSAGTPSSASLNGTGLRRRRAAGAGAGAADSTCAAAVCGPHIDPIPVAEDAEAELIEWPVEQAMRASLAIKRRQLYATYGGPGGVAAAAAPTSAAAVAAAAGAYGVDHPEIALRKAKLDMLRARVTSLLEASASGTPTTPAEPGATPGGDAAGAAAATPRTGAGSGMLSALSIRRVPSNGIAPSPQEVVDEDTAASAPASAAGSGVVAPLPAAGSGEATAVPVAGTGTTTTVPATVGGAAAASSASGAPPPAQTAWGSFHAGDASARAALTAAAASGVPSVSTRVLHSAPHSFSQQSRTASTVTHPALTTTWGIAPGGAMGAGGTAADRDFARGMHTLTDVSIDDRSSEFYSGIHSSIGRRVSARSLPMAIHAVRMMQQHTKSLPAGAAATSRKEADWELAPVSPHAGGTGIAPLTSVSSSDSPYSPPGAPVPGDSSGTPMVHAPAAAAPAPA